MKKFLIFSGLVSMWLVFTAGTIDLDFLFDYANQIRPDYITQDNTDINEITNPGATLGRVLFYDKNLSTDNTIACASCHQQQFAFSDTSLVSTGVNGVTGRHSMRLVNARFSELGRFFWDKRASTLEEQTTMPIQDHAEMGYSGQNGDPSFDDLIQKLYTVDYYDDLFYFVYGDETITEERIQESLAQFIRSIQSFDTKYDEGLSMVDNEMMPFPNFSDAENRGKQLFMQEPEFDMEANRIGGGAGCDNCHRAPEFDIDPLSRSNGIITEISGDINIEIHRSPSLRDMFNPITGDLNGQLMHTGEFSDMASVLDHYSNLGVNLTVSELQHIDTRLRVGPRAQVLHLTDQDKSDMESFLRTLTGTDMYVNEMWSDPFDPDGSLSVISSPLSTDSAEANDYNLDIFPNPVVDRLNINAEEGKIQQVTVHDQRGKVLVKYKLNTANKVQINFEDYSSGIYFISVSLNGDRTTVQKVVKL
jgi:cytochrome c peroxidase